MKNNAFEYVYYLIIILLMIAGIYFFIDTQIQKDMFLLNHFKFFDYEQSPVIYYIGQFGIAWLIAFITYLLLKISRKRKKTKSSKFNAI